MSKLAKFFTEKKVRSFEDVIGCISSILGVVDFDLNKSLDTIDRSKFDSNKMDLYVPVLHDIFMYCMMIDDFTLMDAALMKGGRLETLFNTHKSNLIRKALSHESLNGFGYLYQRGADQVEAIVLSDLWHIALYDKSIDFSRLRSVLNRFNRDRVKSAINSLEIDGSPRKQTIIQNAACAGNVAACDLLIEFGADVNLLGRRAGNNQPFVITFLKVCPIVRQLECLELLLKHGLDYSCIQEEDLDLTGDGKITESVSRFFHSAQDASWEEARVHAKKIIQFFREKIQLSFSKRLELCKTDLSTIPKEFLDPITHDLIDDPVIASDGFCYDRKSFQDVMERSNKISPMTRDVLEEKAYPCHYLRSKIVEYIEKVEEEFKRSPIKPSISSP